MKACIKADELVERPIENFSINKEQKDLKYYDFYHGQRFTGKINEKQTFGRVTIENNKIYLCQDVEDGADCQDKQGYTYSYTLSDRENTINDEDMEMVEDLKIEKPNVAGDFLKTDETLNKPQHELKFSDFYQGQKFTGSICGNPTFGKITIENNKIYLCQDEFQGDYCTELNGYTKSYVISVLPNKVNLDNHTDIEVEDLVVEKPKLYKKLTEMSDGYIITGIQKAVKSDFISPDEILDKKQEDLKFADFYHGQKFTGIVGLDKVKCDGLIAIEDDRIYLCQNNVNGVPSRDKHEYAYSYAIRHKENRVGHVKNLILQKPLKKDVEIKIKDKEYINITNLEDTNDPRIMSAFMEDLSLVGFSKINDGPIFLVKNKKLNDFDYYKNSIHTPISDVGGEINILTEEDVKKHITI